MPNFIKLFQESAQSQRRDQHDARFQASRDDQVNFDKVKLIVESCTWTDFTQPGNRRHCETVNIPAGPAVGHLQTSSRNPNYLKVTFKNGMIHGPECAHELYRSEYYKQTVGSSPLRLMHSDLEGIVNLVYVGQAPGLNKRLELPLDSRRPDLIQEFGRIVKVDPSRDMFEPIHDEMDYGLLFDFPVGPRGAKATLCSTNNDYRGNFVCRVIMKGKALSSQGQQRIGDAIAHLKKTQPKNADLQALEVCSHKGKNVVAFTMEGELECKWGYAYTANLQ